MSGLCVQHARRPAQLLNALRCCLQTTATSTPGRRMPAPRPLPSRLFCGTGASSIRWPSAMRFYQQQQQHRLHMPTTSSSIFGSFSTQATGNGAGNAAGASQKRPPTTTETNKTMTTSCEALHSANAKDDERLSSGCDNKNAPATAATDTGKKPGIIAQFKDLYKRYWYVMVPVHLVTSSLWLGGFYYLSVSGVDVPDLLRSIDVSDSIVSRFEQSKMGHLAIAYLCYKIATPVRYAVTVGGTTVSIKYLSQWGYIKPLPSNERLLEIYADKKAQMKAGYTEMQTKATDAMTGKSVGGSKDDGGPEKKTK